jgi:hypothetical protein
MYTEFSCEIFASFRLYLFRIKALLLDMDLRFDQQSIQAVFLESTRPNFRQSPINTRQQRATHTHKLKTIFTKKRVFPI